MKQDHKHLIVLAGPTASGKTATAIALAQTLGTAILSADSRQCYREMTIGTAKPSPEELAAVPHYFINSHSITDNLNAGDFERLGLAYAQELFASQDVAVVCGGTGLYIQALCSGIDEMPPVNKDIETGLHRLYQENGLAWLQATTRKEDPDFFATAEQDNPMRLLRALVFKRSTGKSILHFRKGIKKERPFHIHKFALDLPRPVLYQRIDQRVTHMMAEGLLDEVRQLLPYRHLKSLNTVGYAELFAYLDGRYSLERAVELIKQHTRNYAKRQLTWFRKDPEFEWLPATGAVQAIIARLQHLR